MGAAASNRGNRLIRQQLADTARPVEFEFMERLNALPKYPDAGTAYIRIRFEYDTTKKIWWALDDQKGVAGFGYWYPSLYEAVKRWDVVITEYRHGAWIADPSSTKVCIHCKTEDSSVSAQEEA